MSRILVCDDEELIRWSISEHLRSEGFEVDTASNGEECLDQVLATPMDAVILDLKMPGIDGLTTLRKIREAGIEVPVLMVTAHGGIDSAITATRLGASGYLPKPFDLREMTLKVNMMLESARLAHEVRYLRGKQQQGYHQIIGESQAMQRVFEMLTRLEDVDAPTVLVTGESGTGKDLVAQALHARGPRRDSAFMEIDCASLPAQLIESELFGHERGAFTDARATKNGLFEVARNGTIFLDEIGELDIGTQAKLLRALESRRFKRVGGVHVLELNAAIIAATNRNLKEEVAAGRFREDLYFRLAVIPIQIPALRQRATDVPLLVSYLLEKLAKRFGRDIPAIGAEALECLCGYAWPGNVRELRNVLERAVILNAPGQSLSLDTLPAEIRFGTMPSSARNKGDVFTLPERGIDLEDVERSFLIQALERAQGVQTVAAKLLGISRYQLRYRIDKHGIEFKYKKSDAPTNSS